MKGEKFFSLIGCVAVDGVDLYDLEPNQKCFVVPIYVDQDGGYFLQNAALKKVSFSTHGEIWKFDEPTVFPEIDRKADLLYGYLFEGSVFIGPYHLLVPKLKQIRQTINFHDMQGILLDYFMNDMEKKIFSSNPTRSLLEFSVG